MGELVPEGPYSTSSEIVQINIKEIFTSKNPRLGRWIPGFVFRYFDQLFHVAEINSFLERNHAYMDLDFADRIIEEFQAHINLIGGERITPEGRYILTANHPLGGLDGIAIIQSVGHIRKDILFPVNDLLLWLPNLRSLFVPISKIGKNSQANMLVLTKAFSSSSMILYFPAGLCSRKQKGGQICDLEWKSTFITRAMKHKRDVVPTFVEALNSPRFYNLAKWRKRLGIGLNLEQALLVDEMYRQQNRSIRLIVGKPIPYQTFDKRCSAEVWAQRVKDHCYALAQDPDLVFPY